MKRGIPRTNAFVSGRLGCGKNAFARIKAVRFEGSPRMRGVASVRGLARAFSASRSGFNATTYPPGRLTLFRHPPSLPRTKLEADPLQFEARPLHCNDRPPDRIISRFHTKTE